MLSKLARAVRRMGLPGSAFAGIAAISLRLIYSDWRIVIGGVLSGVAVLVVLAFWRDWVRWLR